VTETLAQLTRDVTSILERVADASAAQLCLEATMARGATVVPMSAASEMSNEPVQITDEDVASLLQSGEINDALEAALERRDVLALERVCASVLPLDAVAQCTPEVCVCVIQQVSECSHTSFVLIHATPIACRGPACSVRCRD
jgi:hypothetical protein